MKAHHGHAINRMIGNYLAADRYYKETVNTKLNMETLTQHEIDEQAMLWQNEVDKLLSEPYLMTTEQDDSGLVCKAIILTRETLDFEQLEKLDLAALAWNLKYTLSGTDRGRISITFKRDEN